MAGFDFSDVDLGNLSPSSPSFADFSSLSLPGGMDMSSLFGPSNFAQLPDFGDIFGNGPPIVAMPESLATGGGGGGLFADITRLVSTAYQGQAMVDQQKLLNKIAAARLGNQLETIRTTPNIWLVLGAGAVALFLFTDRRDSRRYK